MKILGNGANEKINWFSFPQHHPGSNCTGSLLLEVPRPSGLQDAGDFPIPI